MDKENKSENSADNRKSTIATLIVMVCTLISRLLGFVRMIVFAAVFGASGTADVINLAFTVPNSLRKLMAEGALSSAFIPILSESLVKSPESGETKKIVRNIIAFQLLVIIPLSIICILFAKPIIEVIAEFKEPWKLELSAELFSWLINYLLFISISAIMIGVLNSHHKFFIPAVTPIIYSLSVISSILFLHNTLGFHSMTVGVLSGGLLQILFQFPLFKRLGYSFLPDFNLRNEKFLRILKQWIPVVITSSVFAITQIIAARFATGLEEGSTSAFSYAIVYWQLPFGVFSASITTVQFPKMSRQAAIMDYEGLKETISYGIRSLFVFLIPSAILLSLFSKEIIAVTIQRGLFSAENTIMTANVLSGYCLGLFSVGAFNFLQRFFYSMKNYKLPFFIAVFTAVIDVILSLWLKETRLRIIGLSIANSIAFTMGFLVMLYFVRRELNGLNIRKIFITVVKVLLSMIPVVIFILLFQNFAGEYWSEGSSFRGFLYLAAGGIGSVLIIILFYKIFRIELLSSIFKGRKTR